MAGDLHLKLTIKADGTAAVSQIKRVEGATKDLGHKAKATARDFTDLNSGIADMARSLGAMVSAGAIVKLSRDMARAADSAKLMQIQLARLSGSAGGFGLAIDLANDLGASLQSTGAALGTFAAPLAKLGQGFAGNLKFVGDLNKSLQVFGVSGQAAASIVEQMAQAFGEGKLQGDELKILAGQASGLYAALEQAVQGILGTQDSLKNLGTQGVVTSDVLFQAFGSVFNSIRSDFASLPDTLEKQETRMATAWGRMLTALDEKLHASDFWKSLTSRLTESMEAAAQALGSTSGSTDALLGRRAELRSQFRGIGMQTGFYGNRDMPRPDTLAAMVAEITGIQRELTGREAALAKPAPGQAQVSPADLAAGARGIVAAAEKAAGLPVGALYALWGAESSWSTNMGIRSSAGALTPFQILPSTGKALGIDVNKTTFEEAAKAAAAYLKQGIEAYGSLEGGYKFYHGGPDTRQWGPKTEAYAARAQALRQGYLSDNRLPDIEGSKAAGAAATKAAAEAQKEINDALREAQAIVEATLTPQEAYVAKVQELVALNERLPEAQRLSAETMQRAVQLYLGEYDKAIDKTEELTEAQKRNQEFGDQLAESAARAFGDLAASFGDADDVLKRLLFTLRDLVIQFTIVRPLAEAFAQSFGSGAGKNGGKAGGLSGIVGGIGKGIGSWIAGLLPFASGGAVSAALAPGVYSRPTLFPMASPGVHRYAAGVGLLGEAGPEAVLPLKRGADGQLGVAGGGGMRVNVHNYAGVQVETRQGSGADEIDILIGQMSERIRRGGNVLSAAIEGSYGLSRGRA